MVRSNRLRNGGDLIYPGQKLYIPPAHSRNSVSATRPAGTKPTVRYRIVNREELEIRATV